MSFRQAALYTDLAEGSGLALEIEGRPIALFRSGTGIYALDNLCPHAGARLAQGRVVGGLLSCPMHGAKFELATGHCQSRRITDQAVVTHTVRVIDGWIEVAVSSGPVSVPER